VVTLHRPSNVDDMIQLAGLMKALTTVGETCPLVFPVHPRTRSRLEAAGLGDQGVGMRLIDPVGYLDFLKLLKYSCIVLTDSGGIQEETTALGLPCLTIRDNTERPITITMGTNRLVGTDTARIIAEAQDVLRRGVTDARIPDLWDGNAAPRIAQEIVRFFDEQP
jgi:UDP-N-acetylglucosamine 2-epimerase (non-hydrolysing)